ncbi:hypothetical protein DLM_1276 [Aquitalea magnusonii]|uniref:DUF2644 domain-containing protein n=1 Tax=Aquitalea magnusonii TaxID=332411 RepID=A0A3G9GAF8_9NEIS|nr:hypothetical protein [Aquitalea magnusonii]BBF84900.1 hypothetical protein DLM_1276 [Aquitalea magnusonii]
MGWLDLIRNPASGRLSTSDSTLVGAFVVSSLVLLWITVSGKLDEWLYVGYLAAWVAQNQASKRAAIARDALQQEEGR